MLSLAFMESVLKKRVAEVLIRQLLLKHKFEPKLSTATTPLIAHDCL